MSLVFKSNEAISDPNGLVPYLEKDLAIVRGVTQGLIDFSNPASLPSGYIEGAALNVGAVVNGLTSGAANGVVTNANFPAGVVNGGLEGSSLNDAYIALPSADFKLPTDGSVRRAVLICWAKLKLTGYPNTANGSILLVGDSNVTSDTTGAFQLGINTNHASAQLLNLTARVLNKGVTIGSPSLLADGAVHQFAALYETDGSTFTRVTMYKDKVISGVSNETFVAPTAGGIISVFDSGAYNGDAAAQSGNYVYRYHVANLTGRDDINADAFLSADYESTIDYVS